MVELYVKKIMTTGQIVGRWKGKEASNKTGNYCNCFFSNLGNKTGFKILQANH